MNSIPIKQFKTNIQDFIKQVINQHTPLKITDPNQGDFIIISAEDWEQQQETLYVLQNSHLMEQINHSQATHTKNKGYSPNQQELDEILSI
ncbi:MULTISPECIES: type II toxin-antitoxin system Phd/YefM family antitoxin [unclassified Moorena]|uniref:type II toxin-antitoxin system Phd/YefM family antitoxin n=1 Tax=unclassified Moorena TaxID=2683338 RepID=UPI0013CD9BCC|nr:MULTISPECIES: type II toxin-antitoxin system Phd/YefM family antitoxin [unclassified Moorena]NEO13649.1 type II toxin-antitoxin system Phd/YefM family antitoxin [Moorena sp. SIO3E8]NEO20364.1 type II toxin-antitoxin system Phd/YefM family antitoxin [Moorena sp. SIO4A5]NEQ00073.1 type II toxin-antitoxin system Phd/YefM family antitoxin [Moorena sp. SIO3F7]NEQ58982.1 type II toxin-antitoxin system Phd/YefM family antitoxin [Moorena sp. SIO4A1]